MSPSIVFDTYWRFAAERHAMYLRRLTAPDGTWTTDAILAKHRFTNVYRVIDRVSQYLIRDVIYRPDRPNTADEILYRILLFKFFNKIDTWEHIERRFGPVTIQNPSPDALDYFLTDLMSAGVKIYSAAYIMPAPKLGATRKHTNHIRLLKLMLSDKLYLFIDRSNSLQAIYERLRSYPGLGDFLAFQYTIDINYSPILDFSEMDLVVAGPGARDGISKCFTDIGGATAEQIIYWMVENQEEEFKRRDLKFDGLFGRPLQPIDCQNVFCEISKYSRAAHPEIAGIAGRTRIKQIFSQSRRPLFPPILPPSWGVNIPDFPTTSSPQHGEQIEMF